MADVQTTIASSSSSSLPVPSTAAPAPRWTYEVFLSFRGDDTRNNFTDHLYAALDRNGINTFKDDENLRKGESISPELLKAIEESRVAVVVFSKNYANSSWCLDELAKIIECHDLMGQRVLSVFYDIDPSDVRGQKQSFQTAFEQHEMKFTENMEKVKRWREALTKAANMSGWDVPKTAYGREAECIKEIVSNILSYTEFYPVEDIIGMESRIRDVKSLLGKKPLDVCMIGIWGMGGIGKTTIARAVFNQILYQFEGSSFVEDVRENGSDKRGLKSLQEKILSEILMEEHVTVRDCHDGISRIRRRLGNKKVLLVLDDVDNVKQLEFLAGNNEWFGPGSRILVTSRDEHVLSWAQEKYAPDLLNDTQAMWVFSRYAFKANSPPKEYEKLSAAAVCRTGQLPLALKVLGSHFYKRNLDFWQSALNALTKIPHKDINGVLRLSFDELNDLEKNIFLDIACLFKGKKRDYVTRIVDSFGFEPVSGITILVEKSLLTISDGNLHMHDLIQEMGQSIVRECYPNSRVWLKEEIKEVMTSTARLETVEAIVERQDYFRLKPRCNSEVFKSMKKLRLLEVNNHFTSSEPTYIPEKLRWLRWVGYPFKSLKITTTELVGLEIPYNHVKVVKLLRMEEKINLTNLKFINLSDSRSLKRFPDVSGVPNLERLDLSSCERLVGVHQSVGLHKKIIYLNLCLCKKLKNLPYYIQMESLQTLNLFDCHSLERVPEFYGEMGRLLVLCLKGCNKIRTLPLSMRLLTGLTLLTLGKNFDEEELVGMELESGSTRLPSLRALDLSRNRLVEDDFPSNLHDACPSLEELTLMGNFFTRLPATISHLSHLKYLNLRDCFNLNELHELPPLIQILNASHCESLQKIGDLSNKYKWLFQISLHFCTKLLKDQDSQSHIANLFEEYFIKKCAAVNHRLSLTVPGTKIPNWFRNQRLGNKIAVELPRNQTTKMIGLAICCLFGRSLFGHIISMQIKFRPPGKEELIDRPKHAAKSDHVWIAYMPFDFLRNLFRDFESEDLLISFKSWNFDVLKCGVCVVYKDDVESMTSIGSCIQDYDELEGFDFDSGNKEGRWSSPTFCFDREKTGDHKTVTVRFDYDPYNFC